MCKNSKRFTKFRFHLNLGKFEGSAEGKKIRGKWKKRKSEEKYKLC